MAAPATEGQFGDDITMNSWKKAMEAVGFDGFFEVGLGGDMTAAYEAEEWAEAYKEGKKKVTSCCPAFVNMVRHHFPELADKISYHDFPDGSSIPSDQSKRSGGSYRDPSDHVSLRNPRW